MILPEFQKHIDEAMDGLNLSDERKAVLQPKIEAQIQISRNNDDEAGYHYAMTIVDSEGKKREGVKIESLVAKIHKNTSDDSIPLVDSNTKLTEEQLKLIAEGKLGIREPKEKADKNAIPGSKVLEERPSLEDVASGKIKIDINA